MYKNTVKVYIFDIVPIQHVAEQRLFNLIIGFIKWLTPSKSMFTTVLVFGTLNKKFRQFDLRDWVERCKRYVNASMHNGLIDVGHCLKVIINKL